jgi:hypothetical protein
VLQKVFDSAQLAVTNQVQQAKYVFHHFRVNVLIAATVSSLTVPVPGTASGVLQCMVFSGASHLLQTILFTKQIHGIFNKSKELNAIFNSIV